MFSDTADIRTHLCRLLERDSIKIDGACSKLSRVLTIQVQMHGGRSKVIFRYSTSVDDGSRRSSRTLPAIQP